MNLIIVRDRNAYASAKASQSQSGKQSPPPDEFDLVRRWDASLDLKAEGAKKFTEVKEDGQIVDYRDVSITGYLSTFKETTEADRDGDAVERGAFSETISEFLKNPVLLIDHMNMVKYLAGNFIKVAEDSRGLFIEAKLSNSPLPEMVDARFKVAEGLLKALSMGGIFYYKEDRRTIFKVKLWEGSLVSIPANQDALFRVRSLNDTEKKFLKAGKSFPDYYTFLRAEQLQNHPGLAA